MADRLTDRRLTGEEAQSQNEPYRLPFVPALTNRDKFGEIDARLVNCYAETDPISGLPFIRKRPGFGALAYGSATVGVKGRGCFYWRDAGRMCYATTANLTVSGMAAITTANSAHTHFEPYVIPSTGIAYLFMESFGGNTYIANSNTNVITQVTDPDFPSLRAAGAVMLDGTMYVMDYLGNIRGSDLNDPFSWSASNTIAANAVPGAGLYLARQLNYILAFKDSSIEVFYNAGNPTGSPLSRVDGALKTIGLDNGSSVGVTACEDALVFLASGSAVSSRGVRVALMRNLEITYISTPAVERQIAYMRSLGSYSWASYLAVGGKRFYVLSFQSATYSLVYDFDEKLWYEWAAYGGSGIYPLGFFTSTTAGSTYGQNTEAGGALYPVNTDDIYTNDNGNAQVVEIYTARFDGGTNRRKTLSKLYLNADSVQTSVLTPAGTISLRWSDDDYQTWSSYRTLDLSKKRPFLANLGTFNRRIFNYKYSADTALRLHSTDLQMDIGTL